jgi:Protein of unknown function (DUF2384)
MTWKIYETYLGGGLYTKFDGAKIYLRAPHAEGDNEVSLDPQVFLAFMLWIDGDPSLKATFLGADGWETIDALRAERGITIPHEVRAKAVAVFGNDARKWLREPSMFLNGNTPLEMIQMPDGVQEVLDYLGCIEDGVYS